MTQRLLPLLSPHCYVEVFGGVRLFFFDKPKSHSEKVDDLNSDLVEFFRIFHDRAALKQLRRKLFYTPIFTRHYTKSSKRIGIYKKIE